MGREFIRKYKIILIYGSSLAILLFLLRWLELRFILISHALEIYIGAIALIFTVLGIWLALKLSKPKIETVIVEKEVRIKDGVEFSLNQKEIERLNLSVRELEVIQLMAEGLSNQEIADRLFLSLNTVKTHTSRVFEKMEVRSRTQAIDKAKKLCIIP